MINSVIKASLHKAESEDKEESINNQV